MTSTDGMAGNSEDAVAAAPSSPTTDGPEHAAHRATGNAGVPDAAATATGTCARCATTTRQLTSTTRVPGMSAAASALWVRPRGKGLCPPCAWMYRSADTRRTPHLVTRRPDSVTAIDPTDLFHVLSSPVSYSTAVLLPDDDGHDVLPYARWGHVSAPGVAVAWNGRDAEMFAAVGRLRRRGFSGTSLGDPTPPLAVFDTLPMREWERTYADWAWVERWRLGLPQWKIALRATTHVTTRVAGTSSREL